MSYIVAFRAESAPIFLPDSFLRIRVPQQSGEIILTFRTRQLERGLSQQIPGNMWIDARGMADSLENSISTFGNMVANITPVIAFSTNAAIADMTFHLAYENTVGLKERQYIQNMLPDEGSNIQKARKINVDTTRQLISAIEASPYKDRITRAITQYSLALRNWIFGYEILATAHLYMGMEALTQAIVRSMRNMHEEDDVLVAKELGIDPNSLQPCERLSTLIDAGVRREILFKGDVETYKMARRASDGFEHGFLPFDEIRDLAQKVRNKTAKLLREGIVNCLNVNEDLKSTLLNHPYNEPLGHAPTIKYVRGWLIGEGDNLSKDSNEYPILAHRMDVKDIEMNESGEYSLRFDQTITPILANGIAFRPKSFEIWNP